MKNTLVCPSCNDEIELTELMRTQVASQIRGELDAEAALVRRELSSQRKSLAEQQSAFALEQASLAEKIQRGIDSQRAEIVAEARKRAAEELTVEIADRDTQLQELSESLAAARQQELKMRKEQRKLESQKEELKLEVARQIDEERQRLVQEARRKFDEEHQLKEAEKDKKITDLAAKLKEMQRKVEQGSQQLQGEVQELALEQMLASTFPIDNIAPVGKGVNGGDCVQIVSNHAGQVFGRILWESKRTKRWGGDWLAKARDDARESRSDCVVIVSEALPEGLVNLHRQADKGLVMAAGFSYPESRHDAIIHEG